MGTQTPTLLLVKPTVNGPETANTWGVDINLNFDKIDAWAGSLLAGDLEGPPGPVGPVGPAGAKGDTGPAGTPGAQGPVGPTGPAGAKGDPGVQGLAGPTGAKGDTGAQGTAGATGPQGPMGDTGPAGTPGAQGAQGPAGATGPQGLPGTPGAQGAQGPTGPAGTVSDGDKGDIIVSGTGSSMMFDSAVVTAAARTLLDDASTAAMLTTLGAAPVVHTHAQSDVTGLTAALALKAPLADPTFTGDPKAPTPATADNDTSIATTAFVKAQGYATTTAMNTADALAVLKAGDTMTGQLVLPAAAPTLATHATHKGYVDGQVAGCITQAAGDTRYVNTIGDSMSGQLSNSPAAGTAGFAGSGGGYGFYATAATIAGLFTTSCATGVRIENANNFQGVVLYNANVPTYSMSLAQHGDGTCWVNQANSAGTVSIGIAGNLILRTSATGLYVLPTSGTYAADIRGIASPGAAVIAWTAGNLQYGMSGANQGAAPYSFYGSTTAFIAGGSWSVSDGRFKAVTGDLDPAQALNAVNAILVKEYQPVTRGARIYIDGREGDEELYGWVAQDVEAILPTAVRDVGVPDIDMLARSALRGVEPPAPDSREAEALAEGDVTVKAINDRYMLTTLWAAVQALSARVAELEGAP